MAHQPEWKFVANLGDVNPLDHGGRFVFVDETGVYEPEMEIYDPDTREVSRFSLDRMARLNGGRRLIPYSVTIPEYLPHPLEHYVEWFSDDIESIASTAGLEPDELRRLFCSVDPLERAQAYMALADYHGLDNLDSYPLVLSRKEARERYVPYL